MIHNPGDVPYALDFIGLCPGSRLPYPLRSLLAHLVYRISSSAAFGWNRPVHAPFDGDVIEAQDGYPDTTQMNLLRDFLRNVVFLPELTEDIQRFAGNYVVIESPKGIAFMAHLRCRSLTVVPGDTVMTGDKTGTVGNAGVSLAPHLHFQMMSEWSSKISSIAERVIPFCFNQYERRENGRWKTVRNRCPESDERIRVTIGREN